MTIHLWHFTNTQAVNLIRKEGFVSRPDLDRSGNFFTLAGETTYKRHGPGLVEVWLEMDEKELAQFKQFSAEGDRVFDFYMIPAERVSACAIRWCYHESFDEVAWRAIKSPPEPS